MCSILEDEPIIQLAKLQISDISQRKCMKCHDNTPVVVIRSNDPQCRDCFLSYCVHKFRMTFGKSRVIADMENLLLSYSGGLCSAALTHLVVEGKSHRSKRQLRFSPTLIYIVEDPVYDAFQIDQKSPTREIIAKMEKTGLDFAVYNLSQIFSAKLEPRYSNIASLKCVPEVNDNDHDSQLYRLVQSAKSLTAKQQLVYTLRCKLLSRIAMLHGVKKVLLGESGTQLAIRMLTNMAQGAGAHLPHELGFLDSRRDGVTFLRPMKAFTKKEIAMYNQINEVDTIFFPNLSTKVDPYSSLQRLTEHFITGLQNDFPNTVYTILRTGEKLDMRDSSSGDTTTLCSLCECPLDTDVGKSSALQDTQFSEQLSVTRTRMLAEQSSASCSALVASNQEPCNKPSANENDCKKETCCGGEVDGSCSTVKRSCGSSSATSAGVVTSLCYCCRLILKDMGDDERHLPPFVTQAAQQQQEKQRRLQMKAEIEDFLLPGADDT